MSAPACPRSASSEGAVSRRSFLIGAAAAGALSTVLLRDLFGPAVSAQDAERLVQFASYPEKRIGSLSGLQADTPHLFLYPREDAPSASFVVKLGVRAGGGVGPDQDVVAFNGYCPHQGGLLTGSYDPEHKIAGPCPLHLSAFDLTRHGILTGGQATEDLPQVVLEVHGDDLFAVGVIGLIYGYASNIRS